jgi:hypothetical protein
VSNDYEVIPPAVMEGLQLYIKEGILPGDFLLAVLENNLSRAIAHADRYSLAGLVPLVRYIYNNAPASAWGTPEKVTKFSHALRKAHREAKS